MSHTQRVAREDRNDERAAMVEAIARVRDRKGFGRVLQYLEIHEQPALEEVGAVVAPARGKLAGWAPATGVGSQSSSTIATKALPVRAFVEPRSTNTVLSPMGRSCLLFLMTAV